MEPFVLPLSDPLATLEMVGGKGMSLAKLARAGMPVPDGFHVTTVAYREFVAANALQPQILRELAAVEAAVPASLEAASQAIARLFASAAIPEEIVKVVGIAYENMGSQAAGGQSSAASVAVRSSATAEDLPGASFAGQQETYLNIRGVGAVIEAVRKCWASLWTARAISYRLRQGISPESVALAVVVQRLIPAEAAGILFTANPISGSRDEMVINAAWGLGEAIVGGVVTPDSITMDKRTGCAVRRETAEKLVMTIRTETGTEEEPVPDPLKRRAVLDDAQAAELAGYGIQIEKLYDMSMDIEWALEKGRFAILQARPITTIGEAGLEWKPPLPDGVYMRTGLVDLLPNPVSPLYATLGIPTMVQQMYPLGKSLIGGNPVFPNGYFTVINSYAYMNAHFSAKAWGWILFFMMPAYPRLLRTLVPYWRDDARPAYQRIVTGWMEKDIEAMPSTDLWQAAQEVVGAASFYIDVLTFATMGVSAGSEAFLTRIYERMARRSGDPPAAALLMGWDNLPVRAEKSLYDLAGFCREHEELSSYVLRTSSAHLAEELARGDAPKELDAADWSDFCRRFKVHLETFGHMVLELDFAKPLPGEHPEPMLEAVKMYLRGKGVNPYERQKASEERRILTARSARGHLKGLRRWAFTKALNWAQSQSEVREDALAEIGIGYPLIRRMLHELGRRMVETGTLREPGEIFWLEKNDVDEILEALVGGLAPGSMGERIAARQAFSQKVKAVTPPPMIPFKKRHLGFDTTIWLAESEANQTGEKLKGVPSSPGKVTAPARVLRGMEDFIRMRPGEVLVAGTTTPAWTPLFAMAAAVVTDIGGPLSHGSIVAREYGIPAVMGTGIATRRIRDGQMITVDGSAGTVMLKE